METDKSNKLSDSWVKKIIKQLKSMYGSRFVDIWSCITAEEMVSAWAIGLAGLSGAEIKHGLDACLQNCKYPPSLPEFRQLCKNGFQQYDVPKRMTPEEKEKEWAEYREIASRHLPGLMERVAKIAEQYRVKT